MLSSVKRLLCPMKIVGGGAGMIKRGEAGHLRQSDYGTNSFQLEDRCVGQLEAVFA